MFVEPTQTFAAPEIGPILGAVVSVTGRDAGAPVQEPLLGVTVIVPLFVVGVAVMELVVEVPVHPEGRFQA